MQIETNLYFSDASTIILLYAKHLYFRALPEL